MKKLHKFISIICIFVLLLSLMPEVSAQQIPTLSFTNNTVTSGSSSSAYCYLSMSNAENISAMDYIITYDSDNLVLTDIRNTGFTSQSDVTVSVNSSEPGVVRVTLISQNGLNGSQYMNLMYFAAKPGAKPGTYPINVLVNDIYNSALESVSANTKSGTITIKEQTVTAKKVSFSNTVSKSAVKVGNSFDYKLSASSLNSLSAGVFEFTYDEEKLKLNNVTLSSALQSTVYDINDSVKGLVKILFASEKAITSGANLVTLNFSAIADGSATVSFKPSELYNYEFNGMSGDAVSKTVTISKPDPVIDYPDFKIMIADVVPSDKEFTVMATIEGGSGVRAGDFVVGYDTSALQCIDVTAEQVNGAWIVFDKNHSGGTVRFSVMSNVDITEDTALVSIKFKAIKNEDSKSSLTLSGAEVHDAKFNKLTLEYIGAEVNAVRPEYTVNFYDSDGITLLFSHKVMSGNSAIAPNPVEIKQNDDKNHLKFSGWDKDYSVITSDVDIFAEYSEEAHTIITQSGHSPTCTETGMTDGKMCIVCEDIIVKQEEIPSNGHSPVTDEGKNPTCTESGLTEGSHCGVCGEVITEQKEIPSNGHSPVAIPDIEAGYGTPGYIGGIQCGVCGTVLKTPEEIPPVEADIKAVLNAEGVLTVSGKLSDKVSTNGTTYLNVYNASGSLIRVEDITMLNQSELEISIDGCDEAETVKIVRWDMLTLKPLSNPIVVRVTIDTTAINAELNNSGVLTVSGRMAFDISENKTVYLGIYDASGKLIKTEDITQYGKSAFEISFAVCRNARSIKIMFWDNLTMKPLCDAIKINVTLSSPVINAELNNNGVLTVSGVLTEAYSADGTVFAAVYDKSNKMLYIEEIAVNEQLEFNVTAEKMENAYSVKVLNWNMQNITPNCDAVKCIIKMN